MKIVSTLLARCEGKPPVTSGFPSQRASNMGFDVFFYVNTSIYTKCVSFSILCSSIMVVLAVPSEVTIEYL